MESVRQIVLSFPVVVFSALLPLLLIYWLLVALRLASLELFERDSLKGDHLASSMVALGFAGVPASVALTLLVVLAGALTLAVELLLLRWLPLGMMRVPVGMGVLWLAFVVASPLASRVCVALSRLFQRRESGHHRCLLGERVRVLGGADAEGWARAALLDNPECEVKLRGKDENMPRAGEIRVLVKYVAQQNAYRSVDEANFLEARAHLRRIKLRRGVNNGAAALP